MILCGVIGSILELICYLIGQRQHLERGHSVDLLNHWSNRVSQVDLVPFSATCGISSHESLPALTREDSVSRECTYSSSPSIEQCITAFN